MRRHTKFLYSIDSSSLTGFGLACTFTVGSCPDSAADWHKIRRAFIMRLTRMGVVRTHWLTEWQRRKVPHLHMAIYFPDDMAVLERMFLRGKIFAAWLELTAHLGTGWRSQDIKSIDGDVGWLKYLSKHAARGVKHYQRAGIPDGWAKSGRLWGYTGEWPSQPPMRFDMPAPAYHRYRRLIRAWRVADARASGSPARIRQARRMLRCNDRQLSPVRGVSEWAGEKITLEIIGLLAAEGWPVIQRSDEE